MKIYKCDRCGGSCAKPANWFHVRQVNYKDSDFCYACACYLVSIAIGIESGNTKVVAADQVAHGEKTEANMQNELYRKEIF